VTFIIAYNGAADGAAGAFEANAAACEAMMRDIDEASLRPRHPHCEAAAAP
jgi:hypothetical protein